MRRFMSANILAGLVLAAAFSAAACETAVASAAGMQFAPHRAVYEMQLDERDAARNIAAVRGRLVFDISGSPCTGYTLNNRMVTRITDAEGGDVLSDIRSETWEDGSGKTFRFNASQYLDSRLTDSLEGVAERQPEHGAIAVKLGAPRDSELTIAGDARFPTQFSLEILEAAIAGQSVVQTRVYDGSENGDQVFDTTAFIGKPIAAGADEEDSMPAGESLKALRSWPISISYFEAGAAGDTTPSYQLSFRLYENGVSRRLRIDYGSFALTGTLSSLEYHTPAPCPLPEPG